VNLRGGWEGRGERGGDIYSVIFMKYWLNEHLEELETTKQDSVTHSFGLLPLVWS
jgi:hypothetical protein